MPDPVIPLKQGQCLPVRQAFVVARETELDRTDGVTPPYRLPAVSYTHLDVYKRQVRSHKEGDLGTMTEAKFLEKVQKEVADKAR